MPREIPKDHPSLDLKKSLEFVFSNLEKGEPSAVIIFIFWFLEQLIKIINLRIEMLF